MLHFLSERVHFWTDSLFSSSFLPFVAFKVRLKKEKGGEKEGWTDVLLWCCVHLLLGHQQDGLNGLRAACRPSETRPWIRISFLGQHLLMWNMKIEFLSFWKSNNFFLKSRWYKESLCNGLNTVFIEYYFQTSNELKNVLALVIKLYYIPYFWLLTWNMLEQLDFNTNWIDWLEPETWFEENSKVHPQNNKLSIKW